jgi:hypothetical protein
MTREELLTQRTDAIALTIHTIADRLDEIARRMLVLCAKAKNEHGWNEAGIKAFNKLQDQRQAILTQLKKLGDDTV